MDRRQQQNPAHKHPGQRQRKMPGPGASAETTTPEPPTAEPLAAEPAKAGPVEEDEVTRLLAAAAADLKARRLTSPVGNNAWEKYQRVLGLSPAHPEAMAGMERGDGELHGPVRRGIGTGGL